MKKVLSLILCLCLCLTLFSALALTASAGVGFTVYVGSTYCGNGTTTLSGGYGTVTVECIGSSVTITLDSCMIGTSYAYSRYGDTYNCGLLFEGDANEPADVTLVLKGYNEIMPSVLILNAASLTVTSIDDGSLTVNTDFRAYCPVLLDRTQLTVTGEQSMRDELFYCDSLTIDRPEVKGGGSLSQTLFTIDTDRIIGLSCKGLTINGGITDISAKNLGLLMMPLEGVIPQLQVNGGVTSFYGEVAAVYICGHYGDMSNIKLGDKIGDYNGNVLASTEADGIFCKQSWIAPDEESPLYFCDADGNIDYWYDYDLMSNAAKFVSLKELTDAYVTFDCGDFGEVAGQQSWIQVQEYGAKIGLLPVPVNTTFRDGKFNNMYFSGWYLEEGDLFDVIDENYVLTHNITLHALWTEGQGTPFKDVKEGNWFKEAADYCYGQNLISGTSSTTFSPNAVCTRAMIVSILYRLSGSPYVSKSDNQFSDVKDSAWYADGVIWAANNGIVAGMGDGKFAPDASITREQLASIMMRYASFRGMRDPDAGMMLIGFPDNDKVSSWAGDGMAWAVGCGLISGNPGKDGQNYLDPKGTATRAQFASILMRYIKATDGALTFYVGDLFYITVPDLWQGNVVCETGKDDTGIYWISLYCKAEYELSGAGRICRVVFDPTHDYFNLPHWEFIGSMLDDYHQIAYNVVHDLPTDVQANEDPASPLAARYFAMSHMRDLLIYDSKWYTFSTGVG